VAGSLVYINEVNLPLSPVVLGWVTISRFDSRRRHYFDMLPTTQVDSAFYPVWDGKMSTSQRAVMLCSWGVKAGMV